MELVPKSNSWTQLDVRGVTPTMAAVEWPQTAGVCDEGLRVRVSRVDGANPPVTHFAITDGMNGICTNGNPLDELLQ